MPNCPVILDRDGTIIEDAHYIKDPAEVKLLPEAAAGLRRMSEVGCPLFVLSNQSGVGRGLITTAEFWAVHQRVCELLQKEKVEIVEFLYCFHKPDDGCACRKPKAGLVPMRHNSQPLDWKKGFVVGDSVVDMELAARIGAQGLLVLTGVGLETQRTQTHRPTFANLLKVADFLADT